jgi:hypothetical protein
MSEPIPLCNRADLVEAAGRSFDVVLWRRDLPGLRRRFEGAPMPT